MSTKMVTLSKMSCLLASMFINCCAKVNSAYEGQIVGSSRYVQKVNVLKLRNACCLLNSKASLISQLKKTVIVYRNRIVCMRVFF